MGWETRGNGRYYYRKRRDGERVLSEYVGRGRSAELYVQLDELRRDRAETESQVQRIRREDAEAFDKQLDVLCGMIGRLTEATLVANGFHKHKGQWRRRRAGIAGRAERAETRKECET